MVPKNILKYTHETIMKENGTKRNPLIPLMNEGLGELKCRRHFFMVFLKNYTWSIKQDGGIWQETSTEEKIALWQFVTHQSGLNLHAP